MVMALSALMAQAAGESSTSWLYQLAPLALIFGVFYVLLIMPARKRQKAHTAMISAISSGDKVTTNGGLIGTVSKVEETQIKLRLAPGVEVTILRSAVSGKVQEENS